MSIFDGMDLFVKNLPPSMTEKQVYQRFKPDLEKAGVKAFQCQKGRGKTVATISILDSDKAAKFLKIHGQVVVPGAGKPRPAQRQLWHMNKPVYFHASNHQTDKYVLSSLQRQEIETQTKQQRRQQRNAPAEIISQDKRTFNINHCAVGQYDYIGNDDLVHVRHFESSLTGSLAFTSRQIFVSLRYPLQGRQQSDEYHIEIPYLAIESYTISARHQGSLTFSLRSAPKMFRKVAEEEEMETMLALLRITKPGMRPKRNPVERERVRGITQLHETIASACLSYRFRLVDASDIDAIQRLKQLSEIPAPIMMTIRSVTQRAFLAQLSALNAALAVEKPFSFALRFQMQKLAWNGKPQTGPLKLQARADECVRLSQPGYCCQIVYGPETRTKLHRQ